LRTDAVPASASPGPKTRASQARKFSKRPQAGKASEAPFPGESFLPGATAQDSLVDRVKTFTGRVLKGFSSTREPAYKAASGEHKVAVRYQTVVDSERQRKIPMAVYYPKGMDEPGSSPVVVMSHGLAGNSATYQYFGRHLASHGYTVLQPTHVGSDTNAVLTRTPVFTFTQSELKHRVEDVKFTLDLVQNKDERLPKELTDSADMSKVALAGHSFGAITAVAMAGVDVKDAEGRKLPLGDKRIDAFIAMSPYGDSLPSHLAGLDVETYHDIKKPILYLSGSKDGLFTLGKGPTVHNKPFEDTGSRDKYHVVIGGTRHAEFAQVIGLLDRRTVEMTESTSTAFLDAHLKGQSEAREYLTEQLPAVARTRESWAFLGPCQQR
jgi:predicted dienelactone hydrolase